MENLARYIIRASFSQDRMTYVPEDSKVVYQSKDGKEEKIFDALEWLAATPVGPKLQRRRMLPCPEQRGAEGSLLWILQQCQPRQSEKTKPG